MFELKKRSGLCAGERGQFFFPDIIMAVVIFLAALMFFFIASDFIFRQVELSSSTNEINELSYQAMSVLVSTPGYPQNWSKYTTSADVNSFGIASSKNVVDSYKLGRLLALLSTDYSATKQKLGFGYYDFSLELVDLNGSTVFSGGQVSSGYTKKLVFDRLVSYQGTEAILRGIVSYAN